MKLFHRQLASMLLLAFSAGIGAADVDPAAYHDQNCTRCHDSGVYTRPDRRVTDFVQLQNQVARCDSMLETKLFPDDLAALVDLLNTRYYGFGK